MATPTSDLTVFWAVVFVRFLLPLLIPKFPIPAILACLVVDAVDQSLFEAFTRLDLAGYQGYDKALDIFYLSIAMLTALRSWVSRAAVQIARVLFYVRLVGVVAFELSDWRPFLVLFPNTFEYFFIFYELVRTRWRPDRVEGRFYLRAAAAMWVAVKLPQEYWIHVARLDFTDVLKERALRAGAATGWGEAVARQPVGFAVLMAAAVVLIVAVRLLTRRVTPPHEHPLTLAADPLPEFIDEAWERDREIARGWRLFDLHLVEKIVLVGFVTVIFARVLPGVDARPVQIMWGSAVVVTINAFLRLRSARAGRSLESGALSFLALAAINVALVVVADRVLRRGDGGLPFPTTLFFLLMLTLIVTLYDRWRPVFDARFSGARRASPCGPAAPATPPPSSS
jgi:hypothetical protein